MHHILSQRHMCNLGQLVTEEPWLEEQLSEGFATMPMHELRREWPVPCRAERNDSLHPCGLWMYTHFRCSLSSAVRSVHICMFKQSAADRHWTGEQNYQGFASMVIHQFEACEQRRNGFFVSKGARSIQLQHAHCKTPFPTHRP